jgi:hypothetical protein
MRDTGIPPVEEDGLPVADEDIAIMQVTVVQRRRNRVRAQVDTQSRTR